MAESVFQNRNKAARAGPRFAERGQCGNRFYYYWKKRWQEATMPRFVEVELAKADRERGPARLGLGTTIEVRLRNGRSLMVATKSEANHLREVLALVE